MEDNYQIGLNKCGEIRHADCVMMDTCTKNNAMSSWLEGHTIWPVIRPLTKSVRTSYKNDNCLQENCCEREGEYIANTELLFINFRTYLTMIKELTLSKY